MIRLKTRRSRYLFIGIIAICLILAIWLVFYLTRQKTPHIPTLTSVSVTITRLDGSPLANTVLNITNYGYAWSGMTDKNGVAVVPPQSIASPIRICALNTPRTSNAQCDLSASVDNSGKALDTANSLVVSLHNNMTK